MNGQGKTDINHLSNLMISQAERICENGQNSSVWDSMISQAVFWDTTPCSFLNKHRRFGRNLDRFPLNTASSVASYTRTICRLDPTDSTQRPGQSSWYSDHDSVGYSCVQPTGAKIFVFSKTPRRALEFTQPPCQWVPVVKRAETWSWTIIIYCRG